jgi:hypothetical protein
MAKTASSTNSSVDKKKTARKPRVHHGSTEALYRNKGPNMHPYVLSRALRTLAKHHGGLNHNSNVAVKGTKGA